MEKKMKIIDPDQMYRAKLTNILIMRELAVQGDHKASVALGISLNAAKKIKAMNTIDCQKLAEDFAEKSILLSASTIDVTISQSLSRKSDILAQAIFKSSTANLA